MKTLFDKVPEDIAKIYKNNGFYYEDVNYINIFRWIWNEKHYHPSITSFPGDTQNKTFISLDSMHVNQPTYKDFVNSYDEAIINIVEYIAKNSEIFLKK